MRVLILHESPAADGLVADFEEAAQAFNRKLDIRLRFLDVGFDLRRFPVSAGEDGVPRSLEAALVRDRPEVVLVLGRGPRLLECVAAARKAGGRVAFHVDAPSDRTARAIARISDLVLGTEDLVPDPALSDERAHLQSPDAPVADALVDVLVRLGRPR